MVARNRMSMLYLTHSSVRRAFGLWTEEIPKILQIYLFRLCLRIEIQFTRQIRILSRYLTFFHSQFFEGLRIEGRWERETGHLTTGGRVSFFYAGGVFQPESVHWEASRSALSGVL